MGLGLTSKGWKASENMDWIHWSYSGFNEFRRAIAAKVGIRLDSMPGYREWEPKKDYLEWDQDDPLTVLLNHSDCDGVIESKDCGPLAERLERISKKFEKDDYHYPALTLLIDLLKHASKTNNQVIFS